MRNYYIGISVLVLFCLVLIGIGFTIVGSPAMQKAIQFDQQRISDFSTIQTNIGTFYSDKNRLPLSLNELYSYSADTPIADPETKKPFKYVPNSDLSYSLCAFFSIDTRKYNAKADLQTIYGVNTQHPKGNYCIQFPPVATNSSNSLSTTDQLISQMPKTVGVWKTTTHLPKVLYEATSNKYTLPNGDTYIYELGGFDPTVNLPVNSAYYAKVQTDGTFGNWKNTVELPRGLRAADSVLYSTNSAAFVYVIGGEYDDQNRLFNNLVYRSQINTDGSLSPWQTISSLPVSLYEANAVLLNGFIYVIGGWTGSSVNTVYYTNINADGSLGSWQTTTSLPVTLAGGGSAGVQTASGEYIYAIGGNVNIYDNNTNVKTVYYAKTLSDGELSPWKQTANFPLGISEQAIDVYQKNNQKYLISLGGFINGTWGIVLYTTAIHDDGTLDPWIPGLWMLPKAISSATSVIADTPQNANIYVLGGGANSIANGGINYVYFTNIDSLLSSQPFPTPTITSVPYGR